MTACSGAHPAVSQLARGCAETVNEAFPGIAAPKQAHADAGRDADKVLADY